jgi:hypothetical protein
MRDVIDARIGAFRCREAVSMPTSLEANHNVDNDTDLTDPDSRDPGRRLGFLAAFCAIPRCYLLDGEMSRKAGYEVISYSRSCDNASSLGMSIACTCRYGDKR